MVDCVKRNAIVPSALRFPALRFPWDRNLIDIQKIKKLSANSHLIEFAEFVIFEAGDRNFVDYKKIDLMKIARLVSNVWVYDFRGGVSDGLLFHFSGTKVDEQFRMNVTGHRLEDLYDAEDKAKLIPGTYHQVYLQKKISYTCRNVTYGLTSGERITSVENIMFPCSADDENINFGLGYVDYSFSNVGVVNTYVLL